MIFWKVNWIKLLDLKKLQIYHQMMMIKRKQGIHDLTNSIFIIIYIILCYVYINKLCKFITIGIFDF